MIALPNPEWSEQKYRYFNVKYTVIKIDDQEYLMFIDAQNHVTAICPKQK